MAVSIECSTKSYVLVLHVRRPYGGCKHEKPSARYSADLQAKTGKTWRILVEFQLDTRLPRGKTNNNSLNRELTSLVDSGEGAREKRRAEVVETFVHVAM